MLPEMSIGDVVSLIALIAGAVWAVVRWVHRGETSRGSVDDHAERLDELESALAALRVENATCDAERKNVRRDVDQNTTDVRDLSRAIMRWHESRQQS